MRRIKGLLESVGVDPRRLEFFNLSAAQGPRWAEICTEFTELVSNLGPSPIWYKLKKSGRLAENRNGAGQEQPA